jgi:acyl-CoA synthetase (AMP-forming)/AMP-acid ligase II
MGAKAGHRNVAAAFAAQAAARPDAIALAVYRGTGAGQSTNLAYGELARRARVRAAGFAARFGPGERVLIALPNGAEFAEVYLGCLYAGLVAVPAPAPAGSATAAERVAAVAEDCVPVLAVAAAGDREALAAQLAKRGLGAVPVQEALETGPGDAEPPDRDPGSDDLAVLQYSSGSTGTPKGVMLTHGNVLANMAMIGRSCAVGPGDRFGGWLPLYHDMGLFGLLTAGFLLGLSSATMPTGDFLRRPAQWLRMLDHCDVTITAVPDFALDLCTRRIPDEALVGLDLSRVRMICDGSEPISAATLSAFNERFAGYGLVPTALTPCYGMAEATLLVTAKPAGRPQTFLAADRAGLAAADAPVLVPAAAEADRVRLVGVGRPAECEVRIVSTEGESVLPEGSIGEICLRGANLAGGYWGRPQESARAFGLRLAEPGAAGAGGPGWLRTGDLGAIRDGELFVTGRIKELIIVRGRNLYPQDLERAARAAHDALAGLVGAAFSVAVPDERIVLVHEIDPRKPKEELPAVAAAIRHRVAAEFGVPCQNVLLVRRGAIRRTTSGKIQRAAMRESFLAGALAAVHSELDAAVRRAVRDAAGPLERPPSDPTARRVPG